MSKAPPKDSGICFPRDAKGARSTSDAGMCEIHMYISLCTHPAICCSSYIHNCVYIFACVELYACPDWVLPVWYLTFFSFSFFTHTQYPAGKAIIAAAIRGSKAPDSEKLAAACEKERNWRFGYNKHFNTLVRACVPHN